jgi:16S rRNA (uracil1498-N3)-methyltransferase
LTLHRHRYLAPRLHVAAALSPGAHVALPPDTAHHARNVLRLQEGESVVVFNGTGGEFAATLCDVTKKGAAIQVGTHVAIEREASVAVTLAQGLSSADRMDYTVQKAVELGVALIQPLACEKSVVRLSGERAATRVAHWQRIAIAACEQCGRNRVPRVLPLARLQDYAPPADVQKLLLAPDADVALGKAFKPAAGSAVVAVGPEAGFSEGEEGRLVASGFQPVKLGGRVLRTETAGPVAIAALLSLSGEF